MQRVRFEFIDHAILSQKRIFLTIKVRHLVRIIHAGIRTENQSKRPVRKDWPFHFVKLMLFPYLVALEPSSLTRAKNFSLASTSPRAR